MNENQPMELHYADNGYTYPVSEGFVDFFGGVSSGPMHHVHMGAMHDQGSTYWSMHMNTPYGLGTSSSQSTSYYGGYDENNHASGMDFSRRAWEYPLTMNAEQPTVLDMPSSEQNIASVTHSVTEEISGSMDHPEDVGTEVTWQDDIDPDSMTYEELLDLGEAVGIQNRGLSQEVIDLLPTSKHKSGGIFSRRKSGERCVICQMRYKRRDRQIILPCKHAYHTECGSKWLSINKTCPVCNTEVFGDEFRQRG